MHTQFYQVGGITIQFNSERPLRSETFEPKFRLFEVDGPGDDTIQLNHYFSLPDLHQDFGQPVYQKLPWLVYRQDHQWVYALTSSLSDRQKIRQISFISADHRTMTIHNGEALTQAYEAGGLTALTMAPTDQVFLARLLARRRGCFLHSDGVKMDGKGYLFVGRSGAGKSTIACQLQNHAEILCDDRMIVRKWPTGYQIHGNWSHGTMPIVSAASAPLIGLFFLEQAGENRIIPMENRQDSLIRLLSCLIRPLTDRSWWDKTLDLLDDLTTTAPCYRLQFDKSGEIYHQLREIG